MEQKDGETYEFELTCPSRGEIVFVDFFSCLIFQRMGGGGIVWSSPMLRNSVYSLAGLQAQNPKQKR